MRKRVKLNNRRSVRLFKAGAVKTEPRNLSPVPMRGGIRL